MHQPLRPHLHNQNTLTHKPHIPTRLMSLHSIRTSFHIIVNPTFQFTSTSMIWSFRTWTIHPKPMSPKLKSLVYIVPDNKPLMTTTGWEKRGQRPAIVSHKFNAALWSLSIFWNTLIQSTNPSPTPLKSNPDHLPTQTPISHHSWCRHILIKDD